MELLNAVLSPLFKIISKWDKSGKRLFYKVHHIYEPFICNYTAFKLFPKYSNYYLKSTIKTTTESGEFAIIIQGLIDTYNDLTLETVRLYKMMYPTAHIIISTWDYTDLMLLARFKAEGCHVVTSPNIDKCGLGNVNYQITTTKAGLLKAKELGATYSLKIRSDLRLYRDGFYEYLKGLLKCFPVKRQNCYNLSGRIITQSGGEGQMFLPNWLQDYWYFGYTDDLINFFDIQFSDSGVHSVVNYLKELGHKVTGDDLVTVRPPEIFLCESFYKKHNDTPVSVKQFWQDIKDIYIIVDAESVQSHWIKYHLRDLSQFYVEYDGMHSFSDPYRHISFADWLNIYTTSYIYEDWMEDIKSKYIVWK